MSLTHIPAELRRLVRDRAAARCEYCLIPETFSFVPHQIDHITAEKHDGLTNETNLAYACLLCNKHKGSDLTSIDPETGAIEPLFHPRRQRWSDHLRLLAGRIEPLTAAGRVTAKLLWFNSFERVQERLLLIEIGAIPLRAIEEPKA